MKIRLAPLLFISLFTFSLLQTATAQNRLAKTLIVSVTDSRTGQQIPGAEVALKGMLSKQRKQTDSTGVAIFKVTMITSSMAIEMDVTLKDASGAVIASDRSKFVINQTLNEYQMPVALSLPGAKKVTVVVADEKNNPVAGAKVQFGANSIAYTQADGTVTFGDIRTSGKIPLSAEKAGFTAAVSTMELNDKTNAYTTTVLLTRKKDETRIIKIHVTSADDGMPVKEAYVLVVGKSMADTYSGTTDQNGDVSLAVAAGAEFDILVKHASYVSSLQPAEPGDTNTSSLEFRLKRKI